MIGIPSFIRKVTPSSTSLLSRRISIFSNFKMKCVSCKDMCPKRTVQSDTANKGREFYSCRRVSTGCNFFSWADGKPSQHTTRKNFTTIDAATTKSTVPINNTLVIYTDGACLGNRDVHKSACPAGWGVVVLSGGGDVGPSQDEGTVVAELFGPVVLDQTSPYFLGGTVGSNNTAELTAIGEALLWCVQYLTTRSPSSIVISRVVIRYDSEYAAKSVLGLFNGKKNVELIAAVRRQYAELRRTHCGAPTTSNTSLEVDFVHVRGHSKSRWNDRADELAGLGAAGEVCSQGRYEVKGKASICNSLSTSEAAIDGVPVASVVTQEYPLHVTSSSSGISFGFGRPEDMQNDDKAVGRASSNCPLSSATMEEAIQASAVTQDQALHVTSSRSGITSDPDWSNNVLNGNELVIYTDGACAGNRNVHKSACPSGWGVVVVSGGGDVGPSQNEGSVIAELFGPVVLDQSSSFYLGATVGSNNTAELTAIGEAMIWCEQYLSTLPESSITRVVIRYDSEYAAKSTQGLFNGKKNLELIAAVRRQYAEFRRAFSTCDVAFVHVRGHSCAKWNDRADELAGWGAAGKMCSEGRYSNEGGDVRTSNNSNSALPKEMFKKTAKGPILGAQNKRKFHELSHCRFADSRLSGYAGGFTKSVNAIRPNVKTESFIRKESISNASNATKEDIIEYLDV